MTENSHREVWPVYRVKVAFERRNEIRMRSYTFTTAGNRDRFLEACRPLGGVAVMLSLDHVMTPEQALAELAEDAFFRDDLQPEPAE